MSDDDKSSHREPSRRTRRARQLRQKATRSEALLWRVLRARQLGGLYFRRQHPIGPYFADFACVPEMLVIEIDGDYHEFTAEQDQVRQAYFESKGWTVFRLTCEDVEENVEGVVESLSRRLGVTFPWRRRPGGGSGMFSTKRPKRPEE